MTFYRRIEEIATQEPEGHTYVLAHYWRSRAAEMRGEPWHRRNLFIERLPPARQSVPFRDAVGGTPVDVSAFRNLTGLEQWQMRTVVIDRRALIRDDVEDYWPRAQAGDFRADDADPRIRRSQRDSNGVIAEAGGMVGEGHLVR